MPTYLNNCIICGHDRFYTIEPYISDRINANYVVCLNCGLVVMNPMPTDDELKEYYSNYYWNLQGDMIHTHIKKQNYRALHIQKYVENNTSAHFLRDLSSVLEIGSSYGVTLHNLRLHIEQGGGQARLFAIEPSESSVRNGKDYYEGVTILGSTVEDLSSYDGTFDFIILSHVLEHFTNPVASLIRIVDKMAENGLCYIEVPNFYGHCSVEYSHNYCFTETSLRNCLTIAQLKPVQFDLFFYSRIFPMHITCLACKNTKSTQPAHICTETVGEIIRQRKARQAVHKRYGVLTRVLNHSLFQSILKLIPNSVKRVFRYFI